MPDGLGFSLLGRAVGLALLGGGFWLLGKGFVDSHILLAVLGSIVILAGMWAIASSRRSWPNG